MIIVDPHMHSCEVWFSDGNLQVLKGTHEEICERIRKAVIINVIELSGESHTEQVCEVYVDNFGIGNVYCSLFKRLGVDFTPITRERRIP